MTDQWHPVEVTVKLENGRWTWQALGDRRLRIAEPPVRTWITALTDAVQELYDDAQLN